MKQPKKMKGKRYSTPKLEKYKIDDLAKGWDLEVIGKTLSRPTQCA